MKLLQSLSFRLTLTYIALFCLSVGVLLGLFYWLNIQRPMDAVKAQIDLEMREMSQIYIVEGGEALTAALNARAVREAEHRPFHAFLEGDGAMITANLPSWPRRTASGWLEIEADVYIDGEESDHIALARDRVFPDGRRLLIGRDVDPLVVLRESLTEIAAWILSGSIVLGIAGGVLMSLAIRSRIDAVNRAARTIISGDLSGRVPVRGTGDDFDRLSETLNLMLTRIEGLFESVRRVSDTVAHELRTPLTRLLTRLETLEAVEDPALRRTLAEAAVAEGRRLHTIFDALLRIARIEAGRHEIALDDADLSGLVAEAAEFYAPDAERRGIRLETRIEPGRHAHADADLLFQAVANLLDNALKYSPSGGTIIVSLEGTAISVCDEGPGIPADEIGRVTERFYRSRTTGEIAGEGLGLSLVAAVAARHGATLRFTDRAPGLCAEIAIPPGNGKAGLDGHVQIQSNE